MRNSKWSWNTCKHIKNDPLRTQFEVFKMQDTAGPGQARTAGYNWDALEDILTRFDERKSLEANSAARESWRKTMIDNAASRQAPKPVMTATGEVPNTRKEKKAAAKAEQENKNRRQPRQQLRRQPNQPRP